MVFFDVIFHAGCGGAILLGQTFSSAELAGGWLRAKVGSAGCFFSCAEVSSYGYFEELDILTLVVKASETQVLFIVIVCHFRFQKFDIRWFDAGARSHHCHPRDGAHDGLAKAGAMCASCVFCPKLATVKHPNCCFVPIQPDTWLSSHKGQTYTHINDVCMCACVHACMCVCVYVCNVCMYVM